MPAQRLLGHVAILEIQRQRGAVLRTGHERVDVVDVDFRLEQRGEHVLEPEFGFDLDHQQVALAEGKAMLLQQVTRGLGVVHHEPDDRAFGGVQHRERENVDVP